MIDIVDRRARILQQIEERVRTWPAPDRAKRIGVTESQLADLLSGKHESFSLDELARIGTLTGVLVIYK